MSDTTPTAVGGDTITLTQRGSPKAFLGLSVRNGLLNLVTLTLYRFWGKTEVRRRLWATTYLNDEAFEYTGLGMELFKGFVLALVVVALPFLIAVFGAQFLGPGLAILVILPIYVFLGFLAGFGRFTAFRYLASRTSWRGVRFQLRGSPSKFGLTMLGYAVLSGLSLGWFWPAADRRLAGRLWGGLSFGDRSLVFRLDEARKVKVYGAYAISWIAGIVAYIGFVIAIMVVILPQVKAGEPSAVPKVGEIIPLYALTFVLLLVYAVVLSPFHAAMLRSIAAGIGLDDVRFKLRLKWWELAGMTLSNLLLALFSLGLLTPFIEARVRKFLIDRIETSGTTDLSTIGQAPDTGPRVGEGLADAFGIATV